MLLMWLRRLLPGIDVRAAGLAAALFAVHPVHAEAVGWILATMHLQATLLILATCLVHDRYLRTGQPAFLLVAAMLFGGAIFTAETGVVFPFFVLMQDRLRLGRWRFMAFSAYGAVLVVYLVARKILLGVSLPLTWDLATAGARLPGFLVEYLRHLLLPWPQPLYLAMPDTGFFHLQSLPVAMFLVAAWAIPLVRMRPVPVVPLLALVWLGVFLAPPLAAVFNPSPLLAMRYVYLPSVGLSILLAWWLDRLPGKGWPHLILPLLLFLPVTFMAHGHWQNDGEVYARIVQWNPNHHAGYLGMARYAERSGNPERASHLYRQALTRATGKARLTVLEPLALLLGQTGDHAASLAMFRELTTLAPERSSAWVGVGNNLWFMKQPEQAAAAYAEAVRMDPRNREACHNLRMALTATGRLRDVPRVCFSGP
ncbi:MAG: tetratricopeptide repeat protein [Magnetococcales bacterium]|nr:tetratricopeptide repeat protein [Magnetococcales bacterium]